MATTSAAELRPVPVARAPRRRMSMWSRVLDVVQAYEILLGLLALLVVMFAPFAIIAINAVKTPTDLAANGPLSLPQIPPWTT